MIELNIQNAKADSAPDTNSPYPHKLAGKFKMINAKTYVSINATAELDMLFMNMDFFTQLLDDGNTAVSGQFTPAAKIQYNGLLGY